jgi:hypothetical protein
MAKKKKRKRRPVAPPVHSAPEAAAHPGSVQPSAHPPARPLGAEPPAPVAPAARRPQQRKKSSRALRTKQSRSRPWVIGVVVLILAVGAIVGAKVTSHKAPSADFNKVRALGGCGPVKTISGLARDHSDGQRIKYSTSPPAGGPHYSAPLNAGFYATGLSTQPSTVSTDENIYRAVHSLEHGAVIVWYDGLSKSDVQKLKDKYEGEDKVLVVQYTDLKSNGHIALTAWGRLDYCTKVSTKAIDAFIEEYRDANSAPEKGFPI